MFHINKTLAVSQQSRIFLRGTDIKALLHVCSKYTTAEDRKAYRAEKSQNTVTEKTNAQQAKRQNK